MKGKWFVTFFAAIPFVAAMLFLQSCGGEGGPVGSGGGLPSPSAAFLALMTPEQKAADYIGSESCATSECHGGVTDGEDPIYTHWQETKHASEGVGCERCHGPGSAHKDDPETEGLILTFPKTTDPVVCGQCHGPTHDQYNFSQHSKLVVDPVEEAIVDPNRYGRTSQCINCHSGVVKVANENGEPTPGMSNERIQELAEFTIGHNPHVANCATCHDPHAQTGNLTDSGKEVQLRRKTFNSDTTAVAPGTTPSTFTGFNHICAQCHNGRGTNPADASLTSSTSRPSMHDSNQYNMLMGFGGVEGSGPVVRNTEHANAPGQCSKCHMPDSRHSFTVSYDQGCAPCHTAADAANRINVTRTQIIDELLVLRAKMEAWATETYSNDLFWEYTSNITAEGFTPPAQSGVPIEVKRARHNYYFVIRSGDYGAHNAPYARHLITVANQNMDSLNPGLRGPSRSGLSTKAKLAILEADRSRARKADMAEIAP